MYNLFANLIQKASGKKNKTLVFFQMIHACGDGSESYKLINGNIIQRLISVHDFL
jgi:hypothetical protein